MIGYDLDGVLITDMKLDWKNASQSEVNAVLRFRKEFPAPIFTPKGDYVIITGRPVTDKEDTLEWVSSFLPNKPLHVYHDNLDMSNPHLYKARMINELGLRMFIESEKHQVEALTNLCPACKIVLFKDLIHEKINELY